MSNKRLFSLLLCLSFLTVTTEAMPKQDFTDEPLVQRCLEMLDIYRDEDFDAYVAAFPEPWLGIFGEKMLRKQLFQRHQKMMHTFQGTPASITIRSLESLEPARIEKERLAAQKAKKVVLNMSNEVDTSILTECKFLLIGENWYFRELRL